MITIIFLDENKETVTISFSHDTNFNDGYAYGVWNVDTNEVRLNDNGWSILQHHRRDIRKLKPMMDKLDKRRSQNQCAVQSHGGLQHVEYYPIKHWLL